MSEVNLEAFQSLELSKYSWVHIEGRNNVSVVKQMIEWIRRVDLKREIVVSLELEEDEPSLCNLMSVDVDVVFVSKDFAGMLGCQTFDDMISILPEKLCQIPVVICAWGELGAMGIDNKTKQVFQSPAFPPKNGVVDTLGAGDTFIASTIFAMHVFKFELGEAIKFGCRVAGAKCGIEGYEQIDQLQIML